MIRSVVFDFDGVILDTELPEYRSWQELYREFGQELELELWHKCVGTDADAFDPCAHLQTLVKKELNREELKAKKREQYYACADLLEPMPGVLDYLESAKVLGVKLGIASSSSSDWVCGHLRRLGLMGYFDTVRTRDYVRRAKPAPELYYQVLDGLECRASEAVAIEDSLNGLLAAKAAGVYCIAVPNEITRGMPLDVADYQIGSLTEISLEDLLVKVSEQ